MQYGLRLVLLAVVLLAVLFLAVFLLLAVVVLAIVERQLPAQVPDRLPCRERLALLVVGFLGVGLAVLIQNEALIEDILVFVVDAVVPNHHHSSLLEIPFLSTRTRQMLTWTPPCRPAGTDVAKHIKFQSQLASM
ncbi:MAG: hypothetical protein ACYTGO_11690, partial [Planctomycetota bacterium]